MKVLVACEFSGVVRDAFTAHGHHAVSCDLLPSETEGLHIIGDVRDHLHKGWDLMIAHPPCTYLANSGVRWLHSDITRWPKLFEAADFFRTLLDAPIPLKAIENPIMHKYAKQLVGSSQDQVIQPWMFGDNETKAIGLWLRGLFPLIVHTNSKPSNVEARVWQMAPSADRQKERSRFFPSVAEAMAKQWSRR